MSEFVEPDRYVLVGFHEILMRITIKNSCEHLFNQLTAAKGNDFVGWWGQ